MDVIRRSLRHSRRVALVSHIDGRIEDIRYHDIITSALKARYALEHEFKIHNKDCRHQLSSHLGRSAEQPRIAVMAGPNRNYLSALFATWMVGGIAVPLPPSYPDEDIEYVLRDSRPSAVLCDDAFVDRMKTLVARQHVDASVAMLSKSDRTTFPVSDLVDMSIEVVQNYRVEDGALMIYTSGTTGRPKGVLHTHQSLHAQLHSMETAWSISERDCVLHCLPLHHIHGIVNSLLLPLFAGGSVEMLPAFSVKGVLDVINEGRASIFMGVPTMYSYMSKAVSSLESRIEKIVAVEGIRRPRLWICGSSACPLPLLQTWKQLSGAFPLERYGMTETGMILGNPLKENLRRPGTVGLPFPGMEVDIRENGELYCRGKQLFSGYWGLPDVTRRSFDSDGWFQTGDTADKDDYGYVSLLGRTSSDIIKHKGFKISALRIESVLLQHQLVEEVCVFGVDDADHGEKIVAVVCGLPKGTRDEELASWCRNKLPKHQVPQMFIRLQTSLPRNAMGKVNKKSLRQDLIHMTQNNR